MPSTPSVPSRAVDAVAVLLVAFVLAYTTLVVQQVLLGLFLAGLVVAGWALLRAGADRRRRHVLGQWVAVGAVLVYGVLVANEGVLAAGVATAVYYVGHVTRPLPAESDPGAPDGPGVRPADDAGGADAGAPERTVGRSDPGDDGDGADDADDVDGTGDADDGHEAGASGADGDGTDSDGDGTDSDGDGTDANGDAGR
jgi:hypothetical protein